MTPEDFDFVQCANRRIGIIDGDTPFNGSGISQVYKIGAVYVRLNNNLLESSPVSVLLRLALCVCFCDIVVTTKLI